MHGWFILLYSKKKAQHCKATVLQQKRKRSCSYHWLTSEILTYECLHYFMFIWFMNIHNIVNPHSLEWILGTRLKEHMLSSRLPSWLTSLPLWGNSGKQCKTHTSELSYPEPRKLRCTGYWHPPLIGWELFLGIHSWVSWPSLCVGQAGSLRQRGPSRSMAGLG